MTATVTALGTGSDGVLDGGRIVRYRSGFVFMGCEGDADGLAIWDVTGDTPSLIGVVTDSGLDFGRGVALDGTLAFLTCRDSGSLVAIDIADPSDASVVDVDSNSDMLGARGCQVVGEHIYVSCAVLNGNGTRGLAVYTHAAGTLTRVARVDGVGSGYLAHDADRALLWAGDYETSGGGTGDRVMAWDISDPDAPTVRSDHQFADELDGCRGIYLDGTTLYIATEGGAGILAVDVSDPDDVTALGWLTDPRLDGARDITPLRAAGGHYLAVSARAAERVVLVAIDDPASMAVVAASAPIVPNAYGCCTDGHRVWVPSTSSGNLYAFDFTAVIESPGELVAAGSGWEPVDAHLASGGSLVPITLTA